MKIGVSAFAWTADFKESHLDLLPLLREHGFTTLEIPMFDPAKIRAAKISQAMLASGFECTVCAILPSLINPISPDPEIRKLSLEHLKACLAAAAEMGAKLLGGPVYAPIGYLPNHRRTTDEWHWAIEAFQALTPTLDVYQIDLAIEPVNRSETFFLNRASDALDLSEAISHSRVGVTLDTFHANIEEKNIAASIRLLGKHLKHLHCSENDRGLLGSGHINFVEIIQALKDIHYAGCAMIEGFGYSPAEPSAPGALWADLTVSPEQIAIDGKRYLSAIADNQLS